MINTIIDIYHGNSIDLDECSAGGIIAIIHKATGGASARLQVSSAPRTRQGARFPVGSLSQPKRSSAVRSRKAKAIKPVLKGFLGDPTQTTSFLLSKKSQPVSIRGSEAGPLRYGRPLPGAVRHDSLEHYPFVYGFSRRRRGFTPRACRALQDLLASRFHIYLSTRPFCCGRPGFDPGLFPCGA